MTPVARALLLVACLALVPVRAATAADPFAGFRIPEHRWSLGTADLSLDGARYHSGVTDQQATRASIGSRGGASWEQGFDSDPLLAWIGLAGSVGAGSTWERSDTRSPMFSSHAESRGSETDEQWSAQAEVRGYPGSGPLGLGLSGSFQGYGMQSRSRSDQRDTRMDVPIRDERRSLDVSRFGQRDLSAEAFAGLGRVRDATVIYDAHVLETRLLETGALARPLSRAGLERLAALLYAAPAFSAPHERPARFVWDEIERVLREDGALRTGALEAFSVMRGQERTARRSRFQRLRGGFAGPFVRARTSYGSTRRERENSYRVWSDGTLFLTDHSYDVDERRQSGDSYWGGGRAELHRPLGWAWQMDGAAEASRPLRDGERGFEVLAQFTLGWDIADRWGADAWLSQRRDSFVPLHVGGRIQVDEWAVTYGASVFYYLEDRTRVSLEVREDQRRYALQSDYRRYGTVRLGLSYRFAGTLAAPGLLAPLGPVH